MQTKLPFPYVPRPQIKLRPYQGCAVEAIFNEWATVQSTLLVMATGLGKTVVAAEVIRRFGKRALVVAHREELITQAVSRIEHSTDLRCEIEMGGMRVTTLPDVVVSTIQTQTAGGDGMGRMSKFAPENFDLLIIDEAHRAPAESYRRMIAYYRQNPRLKILGLSATPDRLDKKAMGNVFDSVAYEYDILPAIEDGWLVPIEQQVVSVEGLDYSHIKTTAGDLNGGELATVLEQENNLQGIAVPTMDIVGNRRTLVFAASVKQAEKLCEIFNRKKAGCAEWVSGTTDKVVRRKTIKKFESGAIQFIVNVAVFTEGFDAPHTEVIVLAFGTKSRAKYTQCIGRGTRPLPGIVDVLPANYMRRHAIKQSPKPYCLVIDFAGNAGRHKLITTADILGGKVSEAAIDRAKKLAEDRGDAVNMSKLLEEAQNEIAEEAAQAEAAAIAEEAARKIKLLARAKFKTRTVSPFDVFDIAPKVDNGFYDDRVLSEPQLALLDRNGIKIDDMKYYEGKALLEEISRRRREGLCTYKQARLLKRNGYNGNETFEEANAIITRLSHSWKSR